MAQNEKVMSVIDQILGNDACLGSYAANYLQTGTGHQVPHLDYPYNDICKKKSWPHIPKYGKDHLFNMNTQAVIMLDDFTVENGGTACVPFSQQNIAWPD